MKRHRRRRRRKTFKSLLRRLSTTPAKMLAVVFALSLLAFAFYITMSAGG